MFIFADADDTVTIMIGNILGTKIANLTENGTDVYMAIVVANAFGLWLWAYALFFAFTGITAASICYFTFLFIKRLYINHQLRIQQVRLSTFTVIQSIKSMQIYSRLCFNQGCVPFRTP